jgi:hypothetical protein
MPFARHLSCVEQLRIAAFVNRWLSILKCWRVASHPFGSGAGDSDGALKEVR